VPFLLVDDFKLFISLSKETSLMRSLIYFILICIYTNSIAQNPIKINQFGYKQGSSKIAVLSDPQIGFNSSESYVPGPIIELRRKTDDNIVFSAPPIPWNNGNIHDQSGDKVWWFDFSSVKDEGEYYVFDPSTSKASYPFFINNSVYSDLLKQVMRAFYYQRSGVAKPYPYAESGWTDTESFQGNDQDKHCRLVTDKNNGATSKDLSGGWFDAGDYNKYVNFTFSTLHNLLFAFEQNPAAFIDNYNIPESSNGIPDILDEIKWELDWLLKMQLADGSVLMKVAHPNFESASPPSADNAPTYYGPAQQSATLTFCSIMAHAALVFQNINDPDLQNYANDLKTKALLSWQWLNDNPGYSHYDNAGFASANPEVSEYDQDAMKLSSSVFLYELTKQISFKNYVNSHYADIHSYQWGFWYPYEQTYQDALLRYTVNPDASVSVVNDIRNSCINSVSNNNDNLLPAFNQKKDAYRAYLADQDYIWGSNQVKAQTGMLYSNMDYFNLDTLNRSKYIEAAEQYIHFISGVNPLALTLITHMDDHGAENSIREIYHSWFGEGTDFDNASTSLYGPPPGYLPGGFNPTYSPDAAYSGPPISPPMLQPIQKSYKDWNTSWPENSWEIAEVSIYVQAAFARLLSYFTEQSFITSNKEVNTLKRNYFKIQPNVVTDQFKIGSNFYDKELNVVLYDTKGRIIYSFKQNTNSNIDISNVAQGLYFVNIKSNYTSETLKLVKQ